MLLRAQTTVDIDPHHAEAVHRLCMLQIRTLYQIDAVREVQPIEEEAEVATGGDQDHHRENTHLDEKHA